MFWEYHNHGDAMIEFFLPVVPFKASHHHKKIVRIGKFSRLADKPELVQARSTYESLLTEYAPATPLDGPIRLELNFYFPYNKSHSKKFKLTVQPKDTKPDCSNLAKTFEDCLCRMGFFHDDGQVSQLIVRKFYSDKAGIGVGIG